jgi:beta-galactosidase
MSTNQPGRRARIEMIPHVLVLYFLAIGASLLYANQSSWESLNNIVSGIFHASANYVALLQFLFASAAIYSGFIIFAGVKWPGIYHDAVNVLLPPVIIGLLVAILGIFTGVNFRIRLDFIWFGFQSWALPVYCMLFAGITIIVLAMLTGLVPAWHARKEPGRGVLRLPPRMTAFFLVVTACVGLPVLLAVLFYFPWTQVFWTNMVLMYDRYSSGALACFVVIVAGNIVVAFLARFTRRNDSRLARFKAYLPASIIIAFSVSIVALVLTCVGMRVMLHAELAGLEGYVAYPLAVLVVCIFLFQLRWTGLPAKVGSSLRCIVPVKLARCLVDPRRKKAFGMVLVAAVAASVFFVSPISLSTPIVDMKPTFELRVVNGVQVPFQNGAIYPSFEHQPDIAEGGARASINLTGTWRFSFVPGASDLSYYPRTPEVIGQLGAGFEAVAFDDASWMDLDVPSSFNRPEGPIAGFQGVQGVCWYRKWVTSTALEHVENSTVRLDCLGMNYIADVWVDGQHAGYHEGGFTSSSFDITGLLVANEVDHLLSIRVDTGGFKNRYYTKEVPGFADWFNHGGIVRSISIEVAPRVHVIRADVRATAVQPDMGSAWAGNASIRANVSIGWPTSASAVTVELGLHPLGFQNNTALLDGHTWRHVNVSALIAPSITSGSLSMNISAGDAPGSPYTVCSFAFDASNLRLWTNKQPSLYALEINITRVADHALVDRFYTQFGFRNFSVDGTGFTLNGAPVFIAGASLHEEWASTGRTLTPGQISTDLFLLKNLSCNMFRSHYPLHPLYYLLADRIGLSSWLECPDYWFNEVNLIEAKRGASMAMFLEMIFRDFNRPSIWFMATTNEPASEGLIVPYLQERKALLESIDPSRVFGFAAASPFLVRPEHAVTDIVGSNCYWGLMDGVLGDHENQARYAVSIISSANPGKPILITEFSAGSHRNADSVTTFGEYCTAFTENPAVGGILYWVFNDYIGHAGDWSSWGVYNKDRAQERPTAAAIRAIYGNLTAANP